jgi:hypothetical protein
MQRPFAFESVNYCTRICTPTEAVLRGVLQGIRRHFAQGVWAEAPCRACVAFQNLAPISSFRTWSVNVAAGGRDTLSGLCNMNFRWPELLGELLGKDVDTALLQPQRAQNQRLPDHAVVCCCLPLRTAVFITAMLTSAVDLNPLCS